MKRWKVIALGIPALITVALWSLVQACLAVDAAQALLDEDPWGD